MSSIIDEEIDKLRSDGGEETREIQTRSHSDEGREGSTETVRNRDSKRERGRRRWRVCF
jgi:hypothetical protein